LVSSDEEETGKRDDSDFSLGLFRDPLLLTDR
jgi:hypothetical protein